MSQAVSRRPAHSAPLLKLTRFDRVAGLVVALVIALGLCVAVLLFVWLAGRWSAATGRTVPVVFHAGTGGDPTSIDTSGLELSAPTLQELQRETDLPLPGLRDSLEAVDEILVNRAADVADLTQALAMPTAGGAMSLGTGKQNSYGETPGAGGISRGERWEIVFAAGASLDEYRKQLDFFRIELAAIGPTGSVEYVRDFAKTSPTVDRGRAGEETRLFMTWRPGSPRQDSDRRLLESAGVATTTKRLVQFIPPDVEKALAQLEFDFAGRDPRMIRRTRFGVRAQGEGFEFYVAEQVPL